MNTTKQAFGLFVSTKRQAKGMTQHDLAKRLFVTESAVSKWERGLSYPDITVVGSLSRELGVSEGELINASDDAVSREIARDALGYRRWKAGVFWSTALAYSVALITCFIVNLAVSHTLSWFWIVVASVAIAFSLTTLPLLRIRPKGWITLGAFVASTFILLTVIWVMTGLGAWLPIPMAAILFAVVIIFGPIWLAQSSVPAPASRHRTVIALGADTVALALLLLVVMVIAGEFPLWVTRSLPIAAIALVIPWAVALFVRYLPIAGLFRAAIAIAFAGSYSSLVLQPAIAWIAHERAGLTVDFSRWDHATISGNVAILSLAACILVAVILAVAASLRWQQRARTV